MIQFKPDDTYDIVKYIDQYPDCISQMIYLFPILEHEFPDGDIIIEMNYDPECYDPFIRLNILKNDYPDDIMEKIDKIRKSQYKKFANCNGYVFVTTSLQKYGVV